MQPAANSLIDPVRIAVIGGTGLSTLPGFTPVASLTVKSPWGAPSSDIKILHHTPSPSPIAAPSDTSSSSAPVPIAFLSRHGHSHELAPHEIPNRANIAALRSLGVRSIIAFSAVGSLQENIRPRDFVVPDQIIDRTKGKSRSPHKDYSASFRNTRSTARSELADTVDLITYPYLSRAAPLTASD